ncbi:hypothetical protein C8A05DRAFT_39372 [Staphylotrichum tortipilum]|uniref:J domain-containing protein n=1 Tax=Staphylotrichum tortipilum TaxID=2831512 RepID=A0AAN6RNL0_9PEZI|nr:hypothetical protein C8A05DRAFT_39372 [Staphylotrichum longicolle]
MADQDLIAYARDAASRGDDLFALLATDATASESDIRRAFRRKALTAHPDKAGDAYDPALYERLERARDVLLTPEAREAYDSGMRAVLQKRVQMEQMSQKRRQMVEELERREEAAKRARTDAAPRAHDAERAALAARGRAKMEEMRRAREQAEARERLTREKLATTTSMTAPKPSEPQPANNPTTTTAPRPSPDGGQPTPPPPTNPPTLTTSTDAYDDRIADLERRLKEKQQRKADKERHRAEKKAGRAAPPLPPQNITPPSPGQGSTPTNPPPAPSSSAAEPQADEDKVSEPAVGQFVKTGDSFASTMARLRAAQAKREEKKRKAEEALAGVMGPA